MLIGERVLLRARIAADVPVLHAELYDDVATRSRADSRPWVPVDATDDRSPFAINAPTPETTSFSIVEIATEELVGDALLWSIDLHNRSAHIGLSLRPTMRGRGFGLEVVRLLCDYAFVTRGLHRLQVDTLADNLVMRRIAESLGFQHEATLRKAAWVTGEFLDEVVYGLLVDEWNARD